MSSDVQNKIKELVNDNPVMLFMKGEKDAPSCGFSARVVDILNALKVPFNSFNVLSDSAVREGVKVFSDWPTLPQLFVRGEFIGGCDIINDLYETGELKAFFKDKNIL